MTKPCPLCSAAETTAIENYRDPIQDRVYALLHCSQCDADFCDPMESPPPEWYARAYPLRLETTATKPDWRFYRFLFDRHPRGEGKTLLDIGTGTGIFVGEAQRRGFDARGVDYDERTIRWGMDHGIRNLTAFPIPNYLAAQAAESMDWVTLFEVLEHVPDPRRLVQDSIRLLKSGGRLIVCVPNRNRPLIGGREDHDYPPHHLTRWSAKTLARLLEREGLRVEWTSDGILPARHLAHALFDALFKGIWRRIKPQCRPSAPASGSESIPSQESMAGQSRRQRVVTIAREIFIAGAMVPIWIGIRLAPAKHGGVLLAMEAIKP
jgi:SAM-dependent methyltransferase